jgi:hypothetical protein
VGTSIEELLDCALESLVRKSELLQALVFLVGFRKLFVT